MSKIFHYINFTLIFLFLVGICVMEEVIVSSSLKTAQDDVYAIERVLEEKNALHDAELINLVDNIEYRWSKNESKMCYMVNHKSIQEIGVEIARLKGCIVIDNIDDFRISLEHINFYCHSYLHFMGASIHNVL